MPLTPEASTSVMPDLACDLDEGGVLQRLAAHARAATGACAVRLEVLDRDGAASPPRRTAAAEWPAARAGFTETSVDLVVDGRAAVRLCLVVPGDGLDEDASARLGDVVQQAVPALRNARAHADSRRLVECTQVFMRAVRGLGEGTSLEEVLQMTTAAARSVLGASGVAVLFPHPSGLHEMRAADIAPGQVARLREHFAVARPRLDDLVAVGGARDVDLSGDRVIVAPVGEVNVERRSLLVWFAHRSAPLDEREQALVDTVAEQVELLLVRSRALREREISIVREERERIARDLHDVVIQRIFAAGLQIKALTRGQVDESLRDQLTGIVGDLDKTMEGVRSAIFDLTYSMCIKPREDVVELGAEYARILGFAPLVCTEGDFETVDPATAAHLLATARELFSNVARHAEASMCRVDLVRCDGWLTLEMTDDGRGIDLDAPRSGLENTRLRALLLGGSLTVARREPSGTVITWRVPVGARGGPEEPAEPEQA
ncbi:sensor histidine kinase [Nocardioides jishulii]|uniref:Uncharacterized protein n=1 Tax=Nocardioides jishulii TaxID=2575440 RepID=A0A4V5TKP3_9ACTN|nr:histidine kinase [Nocardioides jishulii]QCX28604.1 hypothetical protein FCL41_14475 [Nocardioides jishulii]TKI64503.1 hypothetical protein FC770_05100 [Nocardioides jishulii]